MIPSTSLLVKSLNSIWFKICSSNSSFNKRCTCGVHCNLNKFVDYLVSQNTCCNSTTLKCKFRNTYAFLVLTYMLPRRYRENCKPRTIILNHYVDQSVSQSGHVGLYYIIVILPGVVHDYVSNIFSCRQSQTSQATRKKIVIVHLLLGATHYRSSAILSVNYIIF